MSKARRATSRSVQIRSRTSEGPWVPVYLSRAILVLAALSLAVPLVTSDRFYYPDVFLKSILFRVAVQAMLLLYAIVAVLSPTYRPRLHRMIWALLAWFGLMTFSSLPGVSVDAWSSWWGDFTWMGGMFSQLHLLAYFFILTQTVREERDWIILFTTSLFCGVLMGFSGLVQYLGLEYIYKFKPWERIRGAAGNEIQFAAHTLFSLFVAVWFLGRRDKASVYPLMAKCWITLLAVTDLVLIGWEILGGGSSPGVFSSGLAILPVMLFALILHGTGLAWFFLRRKNLAGNSFLGLLVCYNFFWIYQSQTRGAMIAALGTLVLLLAAYLWAAVDRRVKWAGAGLLSVILWLPAIAVINRESGWVKSNSALRRLTLVSFRDIGVARLGAWQAGTRGLLDRPFFGWGPENFRNAFDLHFPPRVYMDPQDPQAWYTRAHNVILDIGTTTGILGLAGYLAFYGLVFFFLLRRWIRTKDPTNSLLVAAILLAYWIQNLSTFDTINTDPILFVVLAYVSCLYAGGGFRAEPDSHRSKGVSPLTLRGGLVIAGVAAALLPALWFLVKQPYDSNRDLRTAISEEQVADPQTGAARYTLREETAALFRTADAYQTTGRYQVREEFANYASELVQSANVSLEDKVRAVKMAVGLLEESIRQEPVNARCYMYLASLVNRSFEAVRQSDSSAARSLGENNLVLLRKAEALSPTRPQVYFEKGETLSLLGNPAEAVTAFEKGSGLCPWVKGPRVDLVVAYISGGRYGDAKREWGRIKAGFSPLTDEDYEHVLRAYNAKKQFEPMVELYREQLEKAPGDATLLAHLAATYRELGEVELARKAAVEAAARSPQLASGLQQFLDSLKPAK